MRLNTIRIPVKDLAESERFYADAIGLPKLFGSPGEGFVGLRLENATVLLELEAAGEFECGRYLGFSIEVDDIVQFYEQCRARGVTFTGPPAAQTWGGSMTHIEDCNANTFSIVEMN